MKLAICDDMEIYLEMLKEKINKHLPDEPHEIDEFSSGEELLENFEKDKYDVAILELLRIALTLTHGISIIFSFQKPYSVLVY